MKRVATTALNFVSVICFFYLLLSPKSKYEWMADFDPEVSVAAIEDASGNLVVAGGVAVVIIWLCQALIAVQLRGTREVLLPFGACILAGVVWYARFN